MSIRPLFRAWLCVPIFCCAQTHDVSSPPSSPPKSKAAAHAESPARTLSRAWIRDALQIDDLAKRNAAIESIRNGLQSHDPVANHAGLIALSAIGEVKYDKQPFRALVLPYLKSSDGAVRAAAMYALYNTVHEPADLDRILAMVDDPSAEVQSSITHAIFLFSGGEVTGKAGDAVAKLLAGEDTRRLREALRGIWGAHLSPEAEQRVLELAHSADPELRHAAIYFGLSTLQPKSEAVVDELVKTLADPVAENAERALWGLGHGVPEPLEPRVADAMLRLLSARSSARIDESTLRLIGMYGTRDHAARLREIVASANATDSQRAAANRALAEIERRQK